MMPSVRKLSEAEVATIEKPSVSPRRIIEVQYDALLNEFSPGDYGEAEPGIGERRITVRNRLRAAAERRAWTLTFLRTRGETLRFRVTAAGERTIFSKEQLDSDEEEESSLDVDFDLTQQNAPAASWRDVDATELERGTLIDFAGMVDTDTAPFDTGTVGRVTENRRQGRGRRITLMMLTTGTPVVWNGAERVRPLNE